ncbi:hypothetical protein BSKO_04196 [Bryopsis sp. KO-2023]|nr:hypothetical protein BSKO_04196 [Bryopsis sp. KO-2023]
MVEGATGLVTSNHGLQMPSWVMGTAPALSEPLADKHTAVHHQERQSSGTVPDGDLAFGMKALRSFALAIGIQGSTLSVLVLDHNNLGDAGVEVLAAGLERAASLKSVSLAYCGIGPAGALRIAATMTGGQAPKYEALNLQGNPLGGKGLENLCEGVKLCPSLKSLNLSSIGVTDAEKAGVEALVKALAVNASIIDVDFSSNDIGDRGCDLFVPLLAVAKHIKVLRLTPRVSRSLGKDIYDSVKLNSAKKSTGKKGTKKKKK